MKGRQDNKRDPVCGMLVDANQNAIEYKQMHFAFCSLQCKQRFLQEPHLYIGKGSHKAPKQEGQKILKQRRLKLDKPLTPEMAEKINSAIQAMMGIEVIKANGDQVTVVYDLMQATEEQIEYELVRVGATLGQGWSTRMRRAFVHYLEETEIESLAVNHTHEGH